MSDKKFACEICKVDAVLQCSRCKVVHYCGVDHQRKDWKNHKNNCRQYEIKRNENLGRYLVATSEIAANTEIFTENPLVFGPKCFGSGEDEEGEERSLKCIGCLRNINEAAFACPKCKWPACHPNCPGLENVKLHGLECPALAIGTRIHFQEAMRSLKFYRTEAILPLKCLMLQCKAPQKWNDLMKLESHVQNFKDNQLLQDFEKRIMAYLNENFLQHLKQMDEKNEKKLFEKLDDETLYKICGILETNAMCIRLENNEELSGIYRVGCMLEHSCVPNCYFSFDAQNGFKLKVKAGREIKKGENLSIMYTHMLWGTQQRQEHLQYTKCFTCHCKRCTDPTELGTNFSALKCLGVGQQTCPGIQLPVDPLDNKTDWACNNCAIKLANDQLKFLMEKITEDVDSLLENRDTKIPELETMIEKLSQFLHPNHYQIFALKHRLIQLYGFQPGYQYYQLTQEQLDQKIQFCVNLLEIIKALDPNLLRLSIYSGTVAYEYFMVLKELKKRSILQHNLAGNVAEKMEEMLIYGKLSLEKDIDISEAKKLYERIKSEIECL